MTALVFAPGTLVVLVGAPGAGKSTFARQYSASWRVSLDAYRELATDDMADQSATPVATQVQNLLLDARLARGLTSLVDATNVYGHVRAGLLARARYWQRPAHAVLFDVPFATCSARNAARTRQVRADVLRSLYEQLPTEQQLRAEGFTVTRLCPTTTSTTDQEGHHPMNAALWPLIDRILSVLNTTNGVSEHETAMRLLKVTEEAGEAAAAYIGMTGQNPRKGTTHTSNDVADELCDVIITAAVALHSFTTTPAAVLNTKLLTAAHRLNALPEHAA